MSREVLDTLKRSIQGALMPDLTILLDAPIEVGLGRIAGREQDHFEREDREFFERVRCCYLDLAAQEPHRIKLIDATLPLDEVWACVGNELKRFIERFDAAAVVEANVG